MRGFVGALGALGLGALIGAIVALMIDPNGHGLWVAGALAGGALSYGMYDYRRTWWAIKFTFKAPFYTVYGVCWLIWQTLKMLVTPDFYKTWFAAVLALWSVTLSMGVAFVLTLVLLMKHPALLLQIPLGGAFTILLAVFAGGMAAFGALLAMSSYGNSKPEDRRQEMRSARDAVWQIARDANPISVLFYWLPVVIWRFLKLCWKVVTLIHDDTRALCFVYGSMGATVGYFLGRLGNGPVHVIGPLAGAAIMMLVAIIIHKLFPSRTSRLSVRI